MINMSIMCPCNLIFIYFEFNVHLIHLSFYIVSIVLCIVIIFLISLLFSNFFFKLSIHFEWWHLIYHSILFMTSLWTIGLQFMRIQVDCLCIFLAICLPSLYIAQTKNLYLPLKCVYFIMFTFVFNLPLKVLTIQKYLDAKLFFKHTFQHLIWFIIILDRIWQICVTHVNLLLIQNFMKRW